MVKPESEDINKFLRELQAFLDRRHAAIFFGDMHGEVWVAGHRIGAVTHVDGDGILEEFKCEC